MRSTSTRWKRIFVVSICVSNFKWIRRMIRRKSLLCALKSIFRVHLKAPKQVVGGLPCSRTFNLLTIHTTDSWLSARFWERFLICWQFYFADLDFISAFAVCIYPQLHFCMILIWKAEDNRVSLNSTCLMEKVFPVLYVWSHFHDVLW